jgi:hypothetical protein
VFYQLSSLTPSEPCFVYKILFYLKLTARVPRLKNSGYRLFGLNISEKSWTYLLAGQLLIGGGLHTAAPACCGLLAGYMYDQDYCSIQKFRFPRFIEVIYSQQSSSLQFNIRESFQHSCLPGKFIPASPIM